jgi:hypothetical protein
MTSMDRRAMPVVGVECVFNDEGVEAFYSRRLRILDIAERIRSGIRNRMRSGVQFVIESDCKTTTKKL